MSRLLDVHNFVADKLAWHSRLMSDAALSLAAKGAGSLMLHDLNASQGGAWRGQESMAEKLGISSRQVRRALAELKAASYLEVDVGKGRGRTNVYRATIPSHENEPGTTPKNGTQVSAESSKNRTQVSAVEKENRTLAAEKQDTGVRQFLDDTITSPLPPRRRRSAGAGHDQAPAPPQSTFREAAIRARLTLQFGEPFVRSYLDPAAWEPTTRRVVCLSPTGHGRLKERAGRMLSEMGVGIDLDPGLHARLPRPLIPMQDAA